MEKNIIDRYLSCIFLKLYYLYNLCLVKVAILFCLKLFLYSIFVICCFIQWSAQPSFAISRAQPGERQGSVSDADSEEENEEGDYTVYECPGLAPVSIVLNAIS